MFWWINFFFGYWNHCWREGVPDSHKRALPNNCGFVDVPSKEPEKLFPYGGY